MDVVDPIRIPLWNRKGEIVAYALIDVEDAHLAEARWRLNGSGYAARTVGRGTRLLHRSVMGLQPGDPQRVDHRDLDRLNCRRSNLRFATHAQNAQNTASRAGSTSAYRGVSWCRFTGKWRAVAYIDKRCCHIGRFTSEVAAAAAAAKFRAAHMPFSSEASEAAGTLPVEPPYLP